jgi:hypothetical protein
MKAWLLHCGWLAASRRRQHGGKGKPGTCPPPDFCGKIKVEGNIGNTSNKNKISIKNVTTRKLKMQ